ncbi:MAG: hypothetical protein JEY94_02760 [Melioribacteraceae bacterium]|nr:hypothetical protein [Melioribacteraceae bacterium]
MFISIIFSSLVVFSVVIVSVFLLSFFGSKIKEQKARNEISIDSTVNNLVTIKKPYEDKKKTRSNVSPYVVKGYANKVSRLDNKFSFDKHYDHSLFVKDNFKTDLSVNSFPRGKNMEILNNQFEFNGAEKDLNSGKLFRNTESALLNKLSAPNSCKEVLDFYGSEKKESDFYTLKTS